MRIELSRLEFSASVDIDATCVYGFKQTNTAHNGQNSSHLFLDACFDLHFQIVNCVIQTHPFILFIRWFHKFPMSMQNAVQCS